MARKMYREAVDSFRKEGETRPVICNKIGIAYHQMTDLRTAKKYYEKAIKLNPKYSEAINNLGTVYYAQKSYRRAIGQYKKSLRIAPESASVYSNLGTAYFARKQYQQAMDAYQQALSLDSDVFERKSSHGILLQERTYTERAKFHYYVAKMYAKSGQNERALLYIRKALEEGFKERSKFMEDPEFQGLRDIEEFKELMALEPRVL
jgi:tetratricopeptide (TPR) repeat protein